MFRNYSVDVLVSRVCMTGGAADNCSLESMWFGHFQVFSNLFKIHKIKLSPRVVIKTLIEEFNAFLTLLVYYFVCSISFSIIILVKCGCFGGNSEISLLPLWG
jgi:hypothetical protein